MNEIGLNKLYVVIEDGKINSTHAYFYKEDAEASNKNGKIMTLLEFLEGPSEHEKLIPGLDRVIRDEVKQILNLYPGLPFEVLVSLYTRDLVKLLVYYSKRLNEQNKKDISKCSLNQFAADDNSIPENKDIVVDLSKEQNFRMSRGSGN